MINSSQDDNTKEQSLADSYSELEKITGEFERGEVDLENGILKFKRGLELAKKLKLRLSAIENEIEEIKIEFKEPHEVNSNDKDLESIPEKRKDDQNDITF